MCPVALPVARSRPPQCIVRCSLYVCGCATLGGRGAGVGDAAMHVLPPCTQGTDANVAIMQSCDEGEWNGGNGLAGQWRDVLRSEGCTRWMVSAPTGAMICCCMDRALGFRQRWPLTGCLQGFVDIIEV
jgi:hypothetical protein